MTSDQQGEEVQGEGQAQVNGQAQSTEGHPNTNPNTATTATNSITSSYDTTSNSSTNSNTNSSSAVIATPSYDVVRGFLCEDPPESPYELDRRFFPSKFGGRPAWLIPENFPTDLNCQKCGKVMSFLMQLYASRNELDEKCFHRQLYVFTCACCPDQFRVFRAQLPLKNPYYSEMNPNSRDQDEVIEEIKDEIRAKCRAVVGKGGESNESDCNLEPIAGLCRRTGLPEACFGVGQDDGHVKIFSEYEIDAEAEDSDEDSGSDSESDGEDIQSDIPDSKDSNKNPNPLNHQNMGPLQPSKDSLDAHALLNDQLSKNMYKEYLSKLRNKEIEELGEEDMAFYKEWSEKNGPKRDTAFAAFQKENDNFPLSILRYISWDYESGKDETGEEGDEVDKEEKMTVAESENHEKDNTTSQQYSIDPLFYTSSEQQKPSDIPCCPHCNQPRTFELQLMPGLIHADHPSRKPTHHEFGTVMVYTCGESCEKKMQCKDQCRYVEEFCWVQKEDLGERRSEGVKETKSKQAEKNEKEKNESNACAGGA
jgi:pre-rRNA-processing protein TSR4